MPGTGQLWMEQERKAQFSPQCGGIHLQIQPGTFLSSSVASVWTDIIKQGAPLKAQYQFQYH